MGRVRALLTIVFAFGICGICSACGEEKPPAPDKPPSAQGDGADAEPAIYIAGQTEAVLTYAGARGEFADAQRADDIPDEARGMVRVTLLGGPKAPQGKVWVANLKNLDADNKVELSTVARNMFEELAAGQGRSSAVEMQLPEGIEPPDISATQGVIVYKTDWCGVCKQLTAYLDRKGVKYEAKDIEKDQSAAAELRAKAEKAGVKTGSVPVIDVNGEIMVGFDRARLEKLL